MLAIYLDHLGNIHATSEPELGETFIAEVKPNQDPWQLIRYYKELYEQPQGSNSLDDDDEFRFDF